MNYKGFSGAGFITRRGIRALALVLVFIVLFAAPLLAMVAVPTLTPSSGYVGTSVTLTGTIDTANGPFAVRWNSDNGTVLKSGTAAGTKVSATFTIPPAAKGTYHIYLVDVSEAASSNDTLAAMASTESPFTVNPLIIVTPTSGVAGTLVAVVGTGFGASETGITVTWDGLPH